MAHSIGMDPIQQQIVYALPILTSVFLKGGEYVDQGQAMSLGDLPYALRVLLQKQIETQGIVRIVGRFPVDLL